MTVQATWPPTQEVTADGIADALAAELAVRWPAKATGLDAVLHYALLPAGKLLRPTLVALSALAVGGELERVLPAAIGFECAHAGSLVHDDIIDHDTVRRGRPAAHARFPASQAIIAGNALYFAWFSALPECAARGATPHQVARALAIQADAGHEACRGAAEELAMSGDVACGTNRYEAMARRKTAVLISAACQVGAVLAGADEAQTAALETFGEHLGLAFQMRDDLLPYDHTMAAAMGKPADSDTRNHRPTFPVVLAYERASAADRNLLIKALTAEADPAHTYTCLQTLLHKTGALAAARMVADQHGQLACRALDALPRGPHTDALTRFALRRPHPTVGTPR